MPETDAQYGKRLYRVVQVPGYITWRIEELWDGGVVRSPYGTRDAAVRTEERIARENGFIDALVLQGVVGEEKSPADAFKKDAVGNWLCVAQCSINIENKEIVFTKGMSFSKGVPFLGIDVAKWLDEHAQR